MKPENKNRIIAVIKKMNDLTENLIRLTIYPNETILFSTKVSIFSLQEELKKLKEVFLKEEI